MPRHGADALVHRHRVRHRHVGAPAVRVLPPRALAAHGEGAHLAQRIEDHRSRGPPRTTTAAITANSGRPAAIGRAVDGIDENREFGVAEAVEPRGVAGDTFLADHHDAGKRLPEPRRHDTLGLLVRVGNEVDRRSSGADLTGAEAPEARQSLLRRFPQNVGNGAHVAFVDGHGSPSFSLRPSKAGRGSLADDARVGGLQPEGCGEERAGIVGLRPLEQVLGRPRSTTRPFCMTTTWLDNARTTRRSWLMNR